MASSRSQRSEKEREKIKTKIKNKKKKNKKNNNNLRCRRRGKDLIRVGGGIIQQPGLLVRIGERRRRKRAVLASFLNLFRLFIILVCRQACVLTPRENGCFFSFSQGG